MADCTQNRDPLKLVREGTSQDQRFPQALDPDKAPVNEREPAHGMVFAQTYSVFLKYFDSNNVASSDWKPFFSEDVSVLLAIAAVQDVEYYKANVKLYFDFLNNSAHLPENLKDHLGYLFSCAATLARQLDMLSIGLPDEMALKGALKNLIKSQLAPAFKNLLLYYRDGLIPDPPPPPTAPYHHEVAPTFSILGSRMTFNDIRDHGLSNDWIAADDATDWPGYLAHLDNLLKYPATRIYGAGVTVFERINHIVTHNLFTSIFDQFLKVYARTVSDAITQLEDTFENWDQHEPHYALFLAFLRLLEYARTEANTLTGRHLDFYYREILRLKEKPTKPGKAHLLVELAKQASTHLFDTGEFFKAGKDDLGNEAFFTNDRDFVANKAKVVALKTVYRHNTEPIENSEIPPGDDTGRFYASPIANSDDGQGAELTSVDQSWHPFHNKIYQNGKLYKIRMPQAEIGFAISSHYLLMAEGIRTVTVDINIGASIGVTLDRKDDVVCLFTSEKGWLDKPASHFKTMGSGVLQVIIEISGADPAITPYVPKIHGYTFDTHLPILLLKLKHRRENPYLYSQLQDIKIEGVELTVAVEGLKTLVVSNDFGPVDTSKPFQPFGASPVAKSSLIIGSKEIFQKTCTSASLNIAWMVDPVGYRNKAISVQPVFLKAGDWETNISSSPIAQNSFDLTAGINQTVIDLPDDSTNEPYNTSSRHGFLRLAIDTDFGQIDYQIDLQNYLIDKAKIFPPENPAPAPGDPLPVIPVISKMTMDYVAKQTIVLNSADSSYANRKAFYFHLTPFGQAEQHPWLKNEVQISSGADVSNTVDLVPQFDNAEFYIGITDLKPPQNLALLFQVVDGTADPLVEKPDPHIHWSYLSGNEWIAFEKNEVEDQTGGLLNSGIITFAMPRAASETNTLLPAKMHWIRGAVVAEIDAVCRLIMVAAQALNATFTNKNNDPAFPAKVLKAGTITKLDQPNAAVKKITQPFATFDGRGKETNTAFYTRVSERLRHKDRPIALWDYERLILEAFPQIYKAKCLNHTHYEPSESGSGIYRELAPGHVTIIAIPNQQSQNLRNSLRPYTSLGLLEEIGSFLRKRLSCFIKLHVKNPQFEEVQVKLKVRLNDGLDETFYKNKLQKTITRFLSPWAFSDGGNPSFGGKIYKSVLIDFIEELPYVDYVTDFQLFHTFYDIEGVQRTLEKNEIEGSKSISILVSVPAEKHVINTIQFTEEDTLDETCPCEP